MKNIDLLPLFIIVLISVIWLSSKPWENVAIALPLAGDILKIGVSGIIGYISRGIADNDK